MGALVMMLSRLGSVRDTKPNPKIEPDELRPNVPPRMM